MQLHLQRIMSNGDHPTAGTKLPPIVAHSVAGVPHQGIDASSADHPMPAAAGATSDDIKMAGSDGVGTIAGGSSVSGNGLFVGKKVLVVDDAVSILKLMTHTLKNKAEAIVTQAKDGQQAVEECEKQHFDLILTDIQMPVLDGFGEARSIRAMEKERGLPRKIIVGISANTKVT